MRIDHDDIILKLDDEWSIVQWKGMEWPDGARMVYYDIVHCRESVARGRDTIIRHCECGTEVPESVRGFLVLCRNRNEVL